MSDPIIEHWMHEPDAPELREFALRSCCSRADGIEMGDVDTAWAHPSGHGPTLDMLVCRSVGLHVDNYHAEWSALWVLQAGPGHALHITDRKARGNTRPRKPAKALTMMAPLTVGSVVLFNGHRVHWLPPAEDGSPLVVANFDFDKRPTRDQIADKIKAAALALTTSTQQIAA